MAYLELSTEDREKHGLPEKIEFVNGRWGMRTLDDVEQQTGLTLDEIVGGTFGTDGERPARRNYRATAAWLYLIVRSAGYRIDWGDWDPLASGMRIEWGDGTQPAAQEAEATDGA